MKKPKFTVGQTLLLKPKHYAGKSTELRPVTIVKVGIKWLTATVIPESSRTIRIDKARLHVCTDDWPDGDCYLDMADYESRPKIEAAYEQLRKDYPYHMPVGMTMTDIHTAREALGL